MGGRVYDPKRWVDDIMFYIDKIEHLGGFKVDLNLLIKHCTHTGDDVLEVLDIVFSKLKFGIKGNDVLEIYESMEHLSIQIEALDSIHNKENFRNVLEQLAVAAQNAANDFSKFKAQMGPFPRHPAAIPKKGGRKQKNRYS